jgi:hypothetical protein
MPLSVFANKLLNPSHYSVAFPTSKYSYLSLKSTIEGARDVMIHNVYCTRYFSPTSSEHQPHAEPLSVDTHEIFMHIAASSPTLWPIMYCLGISYSPSYVGKGWGRAQPFIRASVFT